LPTAAASVKAGSLRALAMMSGRRAALLPDVPTMAESGAPNQEADVFTGILARAGTPPEVIALLHREVASLMTQPEIKERLAALGFEPVVSTPEEFAAWIKAEITRWGAVIRTANIRAH